MFHYQNHGDHRYGIALIYLGLGDKASALEWLNKAYEERFVWMVYLNVDPVFDPLRQEFGFKQLQKRMKFPEQVGVGFRQASAHD